LYTALALGTGIVIDDSLRVPLLVWGSLAGGAWIIAGLLFSRQWPRLLTVCLMVAVVAAGGLRYHQSTRLSPPHHVRHAVAWGERGLLTGRVDGEPELRGTQDARRLRLLLRAESWHPEGAAEESAAPITGLILVTLPDLPVAINGADRLAMRCRLSRPQPARNPGAFDYRRFLALQGIHATARATSGDLLSVEQLPDVWWRQVLVTPLREGARRILTAHLSGAPAGLLRGMLLGDGFAIPADVSDRFRATGLAHALVISGLHVGLVALFFFTAFRLVRLPPEIAYVLTTAVLVVYAFVTDLQAPVVRSTVMAGIVMIGRALGRRGDVYNCLGLAALVLLLLWPTSLLTLSFQLSFGATFAIVGLYGPLRQCLPWKRTDDSFCGRWILAPACVSVAAQLGTGPLIAWHFQQIAPISLPANLLVVPMLGLAVALGLLTVLAGAVWPPAGLPFAGASYLVLQALLGTVDVFSRVPPWVTPRPDALFLVCTAVAAVLVAHTPDRRWARVGLLMLALLWANLSLWPRLLTARPLEVVFLDVDQGDGAFLRFPNGSTMIIDAGIRSRRRDIGERVVVPFLHRQGVRRVDVVVASHPHSDHIGGLVHLLEEVEVGHYLDSGQAYDTWTANRIQQLIELKGIQYHRLAAGDSLAGLGGVGGLVLHPTPEFVAIDGSSPQGLNNGSVVLRLDYGGTRILFTGDIEAESEPAMRRWGPQLRADVLKAAHHGSRTSSGAGFLRAVDPELAIVSVGAYNKFGHPAPEVLARLVDTGVAVYRTDRCGAVTLRIEAHGPRHLRPTVPEICD
jgi:competence protein ComEC